MVRLDVSPAADCIVSRLDAETGRQIAHRTMNSQQVRRCSVPPLVRRKEICGARASGFTPRATEP